MNGPLSAGSPGTPHGAFDPLADGWEIDVTTPFTSLVGPIWRRRIGGAFVNGLLTDRRHASADGIVDRGVVLTFADHAIGIVGTHLFPTVSQVTLQLSTMFSADAKIGDFIVGRSEVVHSAGSFIFVRGLLSVGELVIASCEGVWKIVKPPFGG
jgi:acyl-coenzyme A thioesterase PaaI-like protein